MKTKRRLKFPWESNLKTAEHTTLQPDNLCAPSAVVVRHPSLTPIGRAHLLVPPQAFKQLQSSGAAATAAGAATLARLARACALADPAAAPGLVGPHATAPSAAVLGGLDLDALEEGAVGGRGGKVGGKGPDLAAGELAAAARAKRAGDAMDVDAQPKVRCVGKDGSTAAA